MTKTSTSYIIRMTASVALLVVLNLGQRSWLPPSGLTSTVRLLENKTTLPKPMVVGIAKLAA